MHKRVSLVVQVGLASGIFFVIFAILLSQLINRFVSENFRSQTVGLTSSFLEKQVDNFLNPKDFEHKSRTSDDIDHDKQVFDPFLQAITTPDVIEFKIWDNQKTVIYAQKTVNDEIDTNEINKTYENNDEYKSAIGGLVATEITTPNAEEHASLTEYKKFMEIYVPVYLTGIENPVGVAEVYYKLDKLDEQIAGNNQSIVLVTAGVFVLLYIVLLAITKRASDTINRQEKQIEEAHENELNKSKELLNLKDEFFFVATHDLKTPVTAISGSIDIIKDTAQNIPQDIKESLDIIEEGSSRLNTLVQDLLEVARSDSGTIKVKAVPVNLKQIIDKVVAEVTPAANEKQVIITANTEESQVLGDEEKLFEVFENLLSNAIKYNKTGGKIEVAARSEGNFITLTVSDTGLGISSQEQSKVFTKFFRSESDAVRKESGTGLGLFVVKMLVEKMGGTISFKSVENQGTAFTIRLQTANQISPIALATKKN